MVHCNGKYRNQSKIYEDNFVKYFHIIFYYYIKSLLVQIILIQSNKKYLSSASTFDIGKDKEKERIICLYHD